MCVVRPVRGVEDYEREPTPEHLGDEEAGTVDISALENG